MACSLAEVVDVDGDRFEEVEIGGCSYDAARDETLLQTGGILWSGRG